MAGRKERGREEGKSDGVVSRSANGIPKGLSACHGLSGRTRSRPCFADATQASLHQSAPRRLGGGGKPAKAEVWLRVLAALREALPGLRQTERITPPQTRKPFVPALSADLRIFVSLWFNACWIEQGRSPTGSVRELLVRLLQRSAGRCFEIPLVVATLAPLCGWDRCELSPVSTPTLSPVRDNPLSFR